MYLYIGDLPDYLGHVLAQARCWNPVDECDLYLAGNQTLVRVEFATVFRIICLYHTSHTRASCACTCVHSLFLLFPIKYVALASRLQKIDEVIVRILLNGVFANCEDLGLMLRGTNVRTGRYPVVHVENLRFFCSVLLRRSLGIRLIFTMLVFNLFLLYPSIAIVRM